MESYYLENTHPAIIDKNDFALVQAETKRRDELRGKTETGWTKYSGKYAFSNLIRCGCCGARYRRHSYKVAGPKENRRRVWICQTKVKKGNDCLANFTIPENEIEVAFNLTIRELLKDETVLNDCMINVAEAIDTGKVKEQLEKFDEELNQHRKRLYELMQIQVNSTHARRQIDDEMQKIMRQSESLQAERDRLITSVERSSLDEMRMDEMRAFISENNPLTDFDKDLFRKLIHHVIVHDRNEIEFFLYMGISRRIRIGKKA